MATLNEAALARLLHSEDGPVGRLVRRKAEEVVAAARLNARTIMHRMPEADWEAVAAAIDFEQHGTEATIGIRDEGSVSRYLAAKEAKEAVIVRRAARSVFSISELPERHRDHER
jgi:hypothetical protein